MAKPIGSQKTGGRKKGTPNKKTQVLAEVLDKANFCVAERILELLPLLPPEKEVAALLQLLSYIQPKRKPSEGSDESESDLKYRPQVIAYIPDNGRRVYDEPIKTAAQLRLEGHDI